MQRLGRLIFYKLTSCRFDDASVRMQYFNISIMMFLDQQLSGDHFSLLDFREHPLGIYHLN